MSSAPPDQSSADRRMSDARHEYNNIAAIVSLSRRPAILQQARKLWDEFRARYPDFSDDPDGIEEILKDQTVN
ncbi:MAG: hypothetical protein SF123_13730 [Chloroflexota bacterium]|nr:hypothetical protein [Chloroflexota bacterium]